MSIYKIPTLAELYADDETAWKSDQFMQLLNNEPPAQWIKTHKQTGIRYLPIDKVEILLDRIFVGRWKRDIKEIKIIANAIQATVRLWAFHPITQEWVFHDGAGAMPIQLKQGATPGDLGAINHNSIQMNTPAAVSYAVKDAAENFGKIFGRDITRKDTVNYQPAFLTDPFNSDQFVEASGGRITPPPPPPPPPPPLSAHIQALDNTSGKLGGTVQTTSITTPPIVAVQGFSADFLAAIPTLEIPIVAASQEIDF